MVNNGWQLPRQSLTTPAPSLMAAPIDPTPHQCDTNQIIIGYIPAIFYSNMFSLAFLEIKSLTKLSATQSSKDKKIGIVVILAIFLSYFSIYLVIFSGNASVDQTIPQDV